MPEPETPQRPTRRPSGIEQEKSRRLFTVAPLTRRRGVVSPIGRGERGSETHRPESQLPVAESLIFRIPFGTPWYRRWPPSAPGRGPISMSQSAARITDSSCSTTTTVLPWSTRLRRMPTIRERSRACIPTLGSSRTKTVSARQAPRQDVRLTRWTSPPESVRESRSRAR